MAGDDLLFPSGAARLSNSNNFPSGTVFHSVTFSGGGYSLQLAIAEPTLAADVINYGDVSASPDELKKINAPVLGLFGAQDRGITPDDVKKFGEQMDKLGKKADITIYPDAGHGFQNPVNGAGYKPEDTADAWSKILMFFARHLKS